MSQEVINVGTTPNDGTGDPLRNAYIKINTNFSEVYSRAQTTPPSSLIGKVGDFAGMYAYDSSKFYYCFADYDGSSLIWAELTTTGNISVDSIENGTSNITIPSTDGNVVIGINGTGDVLTVSDDGIYTSNITGTLITSAQPQITSVGTLTTLEVTGNTDTGNINVTGLAAIVGNASAGNIATTGNVNAANVVATAAVIATGNVQGGNIATPGNILGTNYSATGNVTVDGTINISSISATGNVEGSGAEFSGNTTTGNLSVIGVIESGPQSVVGNIDVSGNLNVIGNVNYENINELVIGDPLIYIAANNSISDLVDIGIVGGYNDGTYQHTGLVRDYTDGVWKLFANVVAEPTTVIDWANAVYDEFKSGSYESTGNVTVAGSIEVGTTFSAAGNVSGSYFLGDGRYLSNIATNGNQIINGASNVQITTAAGDVTFGVNNTSNVVVVSDTQLSVAGNVSGTYVLGNGAFLTGVAAGYTDANVEAYLPTYTGNLVSLTGPVTTTNTVTGAIISATGNVTGGNLIATGDIDAATGTIDTLDGATGSFSGTVTAGNVSTSGDIDASTGTIATLDGTTGSFTGNVTGGNLRTGGVVSATGTITAGGFSTSGVVSASGNVTGGNIVTGGVLSVNSTSDVTAIVNAGSNAVGNIGSSTKYFNQVFAQATTALYADVAEKYIADADYAPGTVLSFGGENEVTISSQDHDVLVAGVVSTDPAYLMNSGADAEHVAEVALLGRVPCRVTGTVRKGQMLVSAGDGSARSERNPEMGSVLGKALEDFDGETGTIEIVVGRL